ncbi:hypothetical protein [Desulfoluna spongiiphila]|uniref:hypothetical protein n=1 Tax=Desulfoluna spongiiphila TaxID=419481 RepID=UPI001113BDB2|nr:hypothetical protein [Desulfoluna spongiiphila]
MNLLVTIQRMPFMVNVQPPAARWGHLETLWRMLGGCGYAFVFYAFACQVTSGNRLGRRFPSQFSEKHDAGLFSFAFRAIAHRRWANDKTQTMAQVGSSGKITFAFDLD